MSDNYYFYLNADHTFRPCTLDEWGSQIYEMKNNHSKHVADEIINDCWVSTVWMGINHQYFDGPPLLFETMVFKDGKSGDDIYMDRYSTWDEAEEGHKKAVQWVMDGCKDE